MDLEWYFISLLLVIENICFWNQIDFVCCISYIQTHDLSLFSFFSVIFMASKFEVPPVVVEKPVLALAKALS